jgi:hypothetical protein
MQVSRFFCVLTFIWQLAGEGLLNLTKPIQNLYFFVDFKNKFKESTTKYSFKLFYFLHFGEISPK